MILPVVLMYQLPRESIFLQSKMGLLPLAEND